MDNSVRSSSHQSDEKSEWKGQDIYDRMLHHIAVNRSGVDRTPEEIVEWKRKCLSLLLESYGIPDTLIIVASRNLMLDMLKE